MGHVSLGLVMAVAAAGSARRPEGAYKAARRECRAALVVAHAQLSARECGLTPAWLAFIPLSGPVSRRPGVGSEMSTGVKEAPAGPGAALFRLPSICSSLIGCSSAGGPVPKDITGQPMLTAADLDGMSSDERQAAFDARVVTDLSELPAEYVAQLQARAAALAARRDSGPASDQDVPHAS
jgi:hypothetical protein